MKPRTWWILLVVVVVIAIAVAISKLPEADPCPNCWLAPSPSEGYRLFAVSTPSLVGEIPRLEKISIHGSGGLAWEVTFVPPYSLPNPGEIIPLFEPPGGLPARFGTPTDAWASWVDRTGPTRIPIQPWIAFRSEVRRSPEPSEISSLD